MQMGLTADLIDCENIEKGATLNGCLTTSGAGFLEVWTDSIATGLVSLGTKQTSHLHFVDKNYMLG